MGRASGSATAGVGGSPGSVPMAGDADPGLSAPRMAGLRVFSLSSVSLNVRAEVVVDVLSSRILLRPSDLHRSRRFYRDVRGLAICREFGPPGVPEWCSSLARAYSRSPGARPARPGTR